MHLNLVVLRALDPVGLAEFYGRLGLTFVIEKHGSGPDHFTCELNGCVFEIYPRRPEDAASTATRIGFGVASIDAILHALGDDGEVLSSPAETPFGRRCVLRDPEGHKIELTETA